MGNQQNTKPYPAQGYRILAIEPDSQASKANLQIFTDFIVQAQPEVKGSISLSLLESIRQKQIMNFLIYNIIDDKERNVVLGSEDETLGLSVRLESLQEVLQLRVTEVIQNSPSAKQGLERQTDYIIGILEYKCYSLDEFTSIIQTAAHQETSVNVCVYSTCKVPSIRMIRLEPRFNWGGPGCIGCEFATGAFHSLKNLNLKILQDKLQDTANNNDSQLKTLMDFNESLEADENQINICESEGLLGVQQQIQFDTELIDKDLCVVTVEDLKQGQIFNFKGQPRYATKGLETNPQMSQSFSRENQWLTDDQDSIPLHSPIQSQSSFVNIHQEDAFTNFGNNDTNTILNKSFQLEEIQKESIKTSSDSNSFKTLKRDTNYRLDVSLLFDLSLQIQQKPFYLYQ